MPEEVAEQLYEAYMTHETAKQKYRDSLKLRGSDPEALRQVAADKLQAAKARSFCAGCRRRGHWHKDAICPLNQQKNMGKDGGFDGVREKGAEDRTAPKTNYPCHVVHVTWDIENGTAPNKLLGITDTACSKSVAGAKWLETYLREAKRIGDSPRFWSSHDSFRFGASKVFDSSYSVSVTFALGGYVIRVLVAIVQGDVPLLLSRGVLAKLGMIMDVAKNQASFNQIGLDRVQLVATDTGHPALPVQPIACPANVAEGSVGIPDEVQILPRGGQYTVFVADGVASESQCKPVSSMHAPTKKVVNNRTGLFYPKKIPSAVSNMLLNENFNPETFLAWWSNTQVSNDFWLEGAETLVRIHVVPRRTFFNPSSWKTDDAQHKQALLRALGMVRSVYGISCKTHRALCVVHGTWQGEADDSMFPALWIGKSVFSRASMPHSFFGTESSLHGPSSTPPDLTLRDEAERAMGAAKGRADRRSSSPWSSSTPEVDSAGDPVHHTGRHEGDGRPCTSGTWPNVDQRTRELGSRAPDSTAHQDQSGHTHEDDPRPRGRSERTHPEFRALQGAQVRRDSHGIPEVGSGRGAEQRWSFGGPEDVCQLGQSRPLREGHDQGVCGSTGPGSIGDDPVQPLRGRKLGDAASSFDEWMLVFCAGGTHGHVQGSRHRSGIDNTSPENEAGVPVGDVIRRKHATGSRCGSTGRDQPPTDKTGGTSRPSRIGTGARSRSAEGMKLNSDFDLVDTHKQFPFNDTIDFQDYNKQFVNDQAVSTEAVHSAPTNDTVDSLDYHKQFVNDQAASTEAVRSALTNGTVDFLDYHKQFVNDQTTSTEAVHSAPTNDTVDSPDYHKQFVNDQAIPTEAVRSALINDTADFLDYHTQFVNDQAIPTEAVRSAPTNDTVDFLDYHTQFVNDQAIPTEAVRSAPTNDTVDFLDYHKQFVNDQAASTEAVRSALTNDTVDFLDYRKQFVNDQATSTEAVRSAPTNDTVDFLDYHKQFTNDQAVSTEAIRSAPTNDTMDLRDYHKQCVEAVRGAPTNNTIDFQDCNKQRVDQAISTKAVRGAPTNDTTDFQDYLKQCVDDQAVPIEADYGDLSYGTKGHFLDSETYLGTLPLGDKTETIYACRENAKDKASNSKPLFIEVYAGKGGMSRAMSKLGYEVVSVERPTWDLDRSDHREAVRELVRDRRPDIVWCAPDCHLWSTMQNLNVKSIDQATALDEARTENHRIHLALVKELYEEQHNGARLAVVEHPGGSLAWKSRAFANLPGRGAVLDQCAYGSQLPDDQGIPGYIKKNTRLQINDDEAATKLSKRCDGTHAHVPLIGSSPGCPSRTKAAAAYQEKFCCEVAKILHEACSKRRKGSSSPGHRPGDEDANLPTASNPIVPKKSRRRSLWKCANRISVLAAWTLTVATSYTAEVLPSPSPVDRPCLLEIGDGQKTLEATASGYCASEPIYVEDLKARPNTDAIRAILRELNPTTMWLHADLLGSYMSLLRDPVEEHLAAGGKVVIEDADDGQFWGTNMAADLLSDPGAVLNYNDSKRYLHVGGSRRDLLDDDVGGDGHSEPNPHEVLHAQGRAQGSNGRQTIHRGSTAISFDGDEGQLKPEVASALKRLHQNLGHPANSDLTRHLRLAGAGSDVIAAAKKLKCQVCERNRRGGVPRPSSLPSILSFNQVVAVDVFSVHDSNNVRHELLSALDLGTGFHLAAKLPAHTHQAMERCFCELWSNTFGAPGTLALDMETGLQLAMARFSEWHGTRIRRAGGQAHWQQGAVERHGRLWKEIFSKVCDEHSVTSGDFHLAITAVNNAVNSLRRDSGYSPAQAVWGRDPDVPGDLLSGNGNEHVEEVITKDRQRAKEHSVRNAARAAYFRCQADARLRRALLQRTRVTGEELETGDSVCIYRKPKNRRSWSWFGPGLIIGREGINFWVSFGGRCHLTAPEHIRKATGEEIGSAFAIRATQEDLHRLLGKDPDDPQAFDGEPAFDDEFQPPGLAGEAAPELGPEDPEEEPGRASSTRKRPGGERFPQQARASRRIRGKTAADEAFGEGGGGHLGDDEDLPNYRDLDGDEDKRPEEAMMTKKAKTTRGREKQLEKEIPWSMIPPELHERFRQAEQKQWGEHVKYEAMEPVSLQESREILANRGHRVLPSRFAYKDKWWSKRKRDPSLDWRPKARLVIGGHLDPDLSTGRLQTDAPTVSRQGVMALLQLLSSNLKHGWKGFAGDITAAFLQGEPLERELYIRQPKCGLGNLHPEQLVRLTKGVFGLVDSPNAWWKKFRATVMKMKMSTASGKNLTIRQCPLDPCIFMVQELHAEDGDNNCPTTKPMAYFAVHVDDVLVVGQEEICELLKQELSQIFPIDEWEGESFDYIGSFIEIDKDGIKVSVDLCRQPAFRGRRGNLPSG